MSGSRLAAALLQGVWVSGLVVAAVALLLAGWRRLSASHRCHLWLGLLVVCLGVPVGGLGVVGWRFQSPGAVTPASRASRAGFRPPGPVLDRTGSSDLEQAPPSDAPENGIASPDDSALGIAVTEGPWGSVTLGAIGLVALLGLLRLAIGLGRLASLKHHAEPADDGGFGWSRLLRAVGLRRRVELLTSDVVGAPIAVGHLRPAVVVSPMVLERLTPEERSQILLHELVHLSRFDDWTLLLQRSIEAVMWFHPAVWWLGRRLDLDREMACDEVVARRLGGGRRYARTLLHLAALLQPEPTLSLAPGLFSARGRLTRRIEALLDPVAAPRSPVRRAAGITTAGLVGMLAATITPIRTVPNLPAASPNPPVTRSDSAGFIHGPLGESLDRALIRYADSGFSGTVLVAKNGTVVLEKGYGLADRERGIPTTAGTRYALAGFTKALTAAAILRLVERNRLALSDPVGRFLPELSGSKADVTIHQLLTHTDGMTRLAAPIFRASQRQFIAALARTPAQFDPGTGYRYNDFGHSVLAIVIERVTGLPYEEFVRRELIHPLGLTIGFEPDRGPVAVEYEGDEARQRPIPRRGYLWGRRGSLGMVGTVRDSYRWLVSLDDPAVISPWMRAAMLEPRVGTDWNAIQGYGWDWMPRPGDAGVLRRVAGTPGFEGEILHDPVNQWSAVILVNSRVGWRFKIWRLIEQLAR